jgi:hypothetical protein
LPSFFGALLQSAALRDFEMRGVFRLHRAPHSKSAELACPRIQWLAGAKPAIWFAGVGVYLSMGVTTMIARAHFAPSAAKASRNLLGA